MKHFAWTVAAVAIAWFFIAIGQWPTLIPLAILYAMNNPWVRSKLMKDGK